MTDSTETELMMEGPLIPAVMPSVADPGWYKVCTSGHECVTLTIAPARG